MDGACFAARNASHKKNLLERFPFLLFYAKLKVPVEVVVRRQRFWYFNRKRENGYDIPVSYAWHLLQGN